jgi:hypothetical protein
MAGEPGVPYRADTGGGVGATPDLRAPLGPPSILRPEDFVALANFNDPTVALKNAYDLTSSLIDNHYKNQMDLAKSQADLKTSAARLQQIGIDNNLLQQRYDQGAQSFPLEQQQRQQALNENQFRLNDAQYNADQLDKAQSEYQAWHDELAKLDPTNPDYANQLAAINAKYPEASMNPRTQSQIAPLLQQQNVKRSQDFQVQARTRQLNELQGYAKPKDPNDPNSGLLSPDFDYQAEVAAGRGPQAIAMAKRQGVINRLQIATAYGTPQDRAWAQSQLDNITGKNLGPGQTPDQTIFGPNGDLNPGTNATLSQIEARITPVPGAKKETKVETGTLDKDTEGTRTTTTITNQPVTPQEVAPVAPPATAVQGPTTPADWAKDPSFQGVMNDIQTKKFVPQGDPGSPVYQAAVTAEIARRRAAAAPAQQAPPQNTVQPVAPPQPGRVPGPQRASKARRGGLSYQGPNQEETDALIREAAERAGIADIEPGIPSWYRPEETGEGAEGGAAAEPRVPSQPAFAGALRAMAYGPSQGEYDHATNYGPLGHLQEGDIAVSPNLLAQFPIGSRVDVVDANGNVLRANRRVADTSWINKNQPTYNSFELWNDQDIGHARLVLHRGLGPETGNGTAQATMPVHENGHPMPRTPREALTLGHGARFMAPDGTLRMVPNNLPQMRYA